MVLRVPLAVTSGVGSEGKVATRMSMVLRVPLTCCHKWCWIRRKSCHQDEHGFESSHLLAVISGVGSEGKVATRMSMVLRVPLTCCHKWCWIRRKSCHQDSMVLRVPLTCCHKWCWIRRKSCHQDEHGFESTTYLLSQVVLDQKEKLPPG